MTGQETTQTDAKINESKMVNDKESDSLAMGATCDDSLIADTDKDNNNRHSGEPEEEEAQTISAETSSETDVSREIDHSSEVKEQVKALLSTRGISSETIAKWGTNAKVSEVVKRELPAYRRVYVDEAVKGTMATLTIDLFATDTIVSHCVCGDIYGAGSC